MEQATQTLKQAYDRNGQSNIGVLKAYTGQLMSTRDLQTGATVLSDYRAQWLKLKKEAEVFEEPHTGAKAATKTTLWTRYRHCLLSHRAQ